MATVTDVLTQFRSGGYYPQATAAQARIYFDDAYKIVMNLIEIRNDESIISVVANQATYDLPVATWKTFSAYWESGPTSGQWFPLGSTSTDYLDAQSKGWRMISPVSQPLQYYISSGPSGNSAKPLFGLYPAPSVTTSGGYPRVRLYVKSYVTLADGDNIPTNLLNYYCILYKMCHLWAIANDPSRKDYWDGEYQKALAENMGFVQDQQQDESSITIVTPFSRLMGRVR